VELPEPAAIDDLAEVALEDYARVVLHARAAEAVRRDEAAGVAAVHVCGLERPPSPAAVADLVAFARDLAARAAGEGLGWS
jgi:hypothetical protein